MRKFWKLFSSSLVLSISFLSCNEESPTDSVSLGSPKAQYCCQAICRRGYCSIPEGVASCTCYCHNGYAFCNLSYEVGMLTMQYETSLSDVDYLRKQGGAANVVADIMEEITEVFIQNDFRIRNPDQIEVYYQLLTKYEEACTGLTPDQLRHISDDEI